MLLELPIVLQSEAYDCGRAAFLCVMRYHGIKVPQVDIPQPCSIDGTDPRILEAIFRRHLLVASGEMTVADLRFHASQNRPVLLLIEVGLIGHWVVSAGVARRKVRVMDPASGIRGIPESELDSHWRDICRDGSHYRRWGIAVGRGQ